MRVCESSEALLGCFSGSPCLILKFVESNFGFLLFLGKFSVASFQRVLFIISQHSLISLRSEGEKTAFQELVHFLPTKWKLTSSTLSRIHVITHGLVTSLGTPQEFSTTQHHDCTVNVHHEVANKVILILSFCVS